MHIYIYIHEYTCIVLHVLAKKRDPQEDVTGKPVKYGTVIKDLRDARDSMCKIKKINLTLEPALKKLRAA